MQIRTRCRYYRDWKPKPGKLSICGVDWPRLNKWNGWNIWT